MDEAAIAELIERIYDLALEPELWPQLLSRLATAFGAHASAIEQEDMSTNRGGGLVVGADPADLQTYFNYYASCNPLRLRDNIVERMKDFTPIVTIDEQTMSKPALMATEFYADFLGKIGIHSIMTIGLWSQGAQFAGVDLYRPRNRSSFTVDEAALAETLQPHLIRAFRLSRQFDESRRVGAGLEAAAQLSPYAILVVELDGRLRHANPQGERMLAEASGLSVLGGRLTATDFADAERLRALIARAVGPEKRVGGGLSIRRPGRAPLTVTAVPVGAERLSLFQAAPGAVLCVTDPEAVASASTSYLREQYGLTPAQSKVAQALLQGRTPREAAEEMGLSFFTVRAHLAQVFEKTGVRRQAELVSLLSKPPPF
jgi:DNA-binding CsgD family transcriptional regulator/PAS domain-containing protein